MERGGGLLVLFGIRLCGVGLGYLCLGVCVGLSGGAEENLISHLPPPVYLCFCRQWFFAFPDIKCQFAGVCSVFVGSGCGPNRRPGSAAGLS